MKNNLNTILFLLFYLLLLSAASCKHTTEPPPNKASLTLTLEDVSCTEAWVTLKLSEIPLPATVTLYKNNNAQNNILCYGDTLLYIDSLLPKQSYKFKAALLTATAPQPSSNELSVETMDTTSHNFTWQSWTFGTIGSSSLYDVAIIDENNIWAVGEILIADTSINGYTTYNAVNWNGSEWKLKRIYFPTVCGSTSVTSYPAKAIVAFNDGQIWISSSGDKIARLQNGVQIDKFCLPSNVSMSINKLWGSSSSDLYVVGNNGNIAHWDGVKWTKIESGTTSNIQEIWGVSDGKGGYYKYLAADNAMLILYDKDELMKINADANMIILSAWAYSNRLIYTAGNGVVLYKNKVWERVNAPTVNKIYRIKGKGVNDILGIGLPGSVVHHFNGYKWSYLETLPGNRFWRLDTKGNIAVFVGYNAEKAMITLLKNQ